MIDSCRVVLTNRCLAPSVMALQFEMADFRWHQTWLPLERVASYMAAFSGAGPALTSAVMAALRLQNLGQSNGAYLGGPEA